jgi:YesN/AraC family two-component response regulator
LEQNLEQLGTDLEQRHEAIILLRYKTMQQAKEPFHVEVKRYLVKPLSLNGLFPDASPRAATHTRHARTDKELVSLAMHESRAQKKPRQPCDCRGAWFRNETRTAWAHR